MVSHGAPVREKANASDTWSCFACTFPNEWQATNCASCGKSWKHKTSWTSWKKRQNRPWAYAEPVSPAPPWNKWNNGPPGGHAKAATAAAAWANPGAPAADDGDKSDRAGEIAKVLKALECCAPLLGANNDFVLGLQKQLEELNTAKPKPLPVHVEVGKFQRKLKQVEQKLVRLSQKLADAAVAILAKQDEIIETDDEIKKTKQEFAELQAKLASIGRRSMPETAVPSVDELGLQNAAPELKRKAAILLRRLLGVIAEAEENEVEEEHAKDPGRTTEEAGAKIEEKIEEKTREALAKQVGEAILAAKAVLRDLPADFVPRVVKPPDIPGAAVTECRPTQHTGDSTASTVPAGQPSPGTPSVTPGASSAAAAGSGGDQIVPYTGGKSSHMDEDLDDEDDFIEAFDDDVEAELHAEHFHGEQKHNEGAPPGKKRATRTRNITLASGAANDALQLAESIVQAAVLNGKRGLQSRG